MAYTTGKFGLGTLSNLGSVIVLFWATGIVFSLLVFGLIARLCGLRILKLYRYFKDELLITLGTSNYEVVMPQLMRKLENLGSPKRIVGLVVPPGYVFNGDGVCLYLGFASLYIAQAFNVDLSLWQQIGLLAVFMVTSKGSAGVAGAASSSSRRPCRPRARPLLSGSCWSWASTGSCRPCEVWSACPDRSWAASSSHAGNALSISNVLAPSSTANPLRPCLTATVPPNHSQRLRPTRSPTLRARPDPPAALPSYASSARKDHDTDGTPGIPER
nr:cation:dicarboxylase symporter family transporter [Saccharopolyspora erythraea]